jgi:hypothetical protein
LKFLCTADALEADSKADLARGDAALGKERSRSRDARLQQEARRRRVIVLAREHRELGRAESRRRRERSRGGIALRIGTQAAHQLDQHVDVGIDAAVEQIGPAASARAEARGARRLGIDEEEHVLGLRLASRATRQAVDLRRLHGDEITPVERAVAPVHAAEHRLPFEFHAAIVRSGRGPSSRFFRWNSQEG